MTTTMKDNAFMGGWGLRGTRNRARVINSFTTRWNEGVGLLD